MPTSISIQLIEDAAALDAALQSFRAQPSLAFDLEFDSHRNAYGVNLCLVQVASPGACCVIDPLAGIDMSSLWAVFEDDRIQKIVHSPGEDLRLLHSLQCFPKNVFDTEVVAKLLNYEQTSLLAMLDAKLGYSLNKAQQRSNWLRRPLSREQIDYAAEDVVGLHALKDILVTEAAAKGLMPFVEEEQAALSTTIHQQERRDFFLKPGDVMHLSPYDQHVLNSLFCFRDELARGLNRPAFQVMDESLLRAFASGEISADDLPYEKGVYGGYRNPRFARQLSDRLAAIRADAAAADLPRQRPPREKSGESRATRAQQDAERAAVFAPIQQELVKRYGEHAARFMLSNGTVNEILKGNMSIGKLKPYRQRLVAEIAAAQGLELGAYL